MQKIIHTAESRGHAEHGWLKTHHSFSFANYFDPERMGFGALRVLNDDSIAPGQGFGRHPHDNIEIITIPLTGALAHQDSMGNSAVVQTGEIQVMSAGTGVEHSEFNASMTEPVTLLQIWIFPNKHDVPPRYDQKKFDPISYTGKMEALVGKIGEAPLGIHQDAKLSLGRFEEDTEIKYALREGQGVYFFVIEGEATISGSFIEKRGAIGIWNTEKIDLTIKKGTFLLAIEIPMA